MKDVVLLIVTLAAFAFGYFIMKKVDAFIIENCRLIDAENRTNSCTIRIAAENPALFDSAVSALEQCSDMNPYIEFSLGCGNAARLLQKLSNGRIDIALLYEENIKALEKGLVYTRIPHLAEKKVITMLGLTVEDMDDERWCYVVWNQSIPSKDRDRVLFYLENEHCPLKCGYCDYLD